MENKILIEQITSLEKSIHELSEILIQIVEDGASVGFLPPLKQRNANNYWKGVLNEEVILLIAKVGSKIVGTVQIHLCTKENGEHRVEIAKLMTHPNFQRMGIGRLLMEEAENRARELGKKLIVLDTREGDPSNYLYSSMGYIQAGRIPHYAKSGNGELEPTIIYYKLI